MVSNILFLQANMAFLYILPDNSNSNNCKCSARGIAIKGVEYFVMNHTV